MCVVYAPVAEMDALHGAIIDARTNPSPLGPAATVDLKASSACDIQLRFALPAAATTITVAGFSIAFAPAPNSVAASADATTGAGSPWSVKVSFGGTSDELPLLPDDKELILRVFLDGTVAEAYWMGGRVAMTVDTKPTDAVSIAASAAATLTEATVFAMQDIHTTVDDVLAQL